MFGEIILSLIGFGILIGLFSAYSDEVLSKDKIELSKHARRLMLLRAQSREPIMQGKASWYGPGFHGKRTASGERFDQNDLTAAHLSLPFQTKVRVTNLRNGRSVVVRINDRGPFHRGRIIDLSKAAAEAVGLIATGTAQVNLEII